jgi:hypothetical protein
MTPIEYGYYMLSVIPRKSAKADSVRVVRAGMLHGLKHDTFEAAERAALAISKNHFVDRVDIKLIVEEFKGAWRQGERALVA